MCNKNYLSPSTFTILNSTTSLITQGQEQLKLGLWSLVKGIPKGIALDEVDGADCARKVAALKKFGLKLAVVHNIKTIAFPAISCGVYEFPVDQAVRIAIGTAIEFLKTDGASIDGVSFVCFSDEDYDIYVEVFGELC